MAGTSIDAVHTLDSATAALHGNVHYLQAIAGMAQSRTVVVTEDIANDQGTLLLHQGWKVDSRLPQRLAGQRLSQPLERQLHVADPIGRTALRAALDELLHTHPLARAIAEELGSEVSDLHEAIQYQPWPDAARFQLTVMHSQMPRLYMHSVLVMLIALYLGLRQHAGLPQCARLAAAGMLHDIGMLYLPASWMNTAYRLSTAERRQLAAHPVTGSAVVHAMGTYPASVATAVLEHHEYMDGSGYPRHLQGSAISHMGHILLLAEVVAAFYDKYHSQAGERLSLLLRLHGQRFAPELLPALQAVLHRERAQRPAEKVAPVAAEHVLRDSEQVATVLAYWRSCQRVLPAQWHTQPGGRAVLWLDTRLKALAAALAESGAHPDQRSAWQTALPQEPALAAELGHIYREALWQLEQDLYTVLRRWPQLQPTADKPTPSVVERAVWTWMASCAQVLGLPPLASPAPTPGQHTPAVPDTARA